MRAIRTKNLAPLLCVLVSATTPFQNSEAQTQRGGVAPVIPKTWDDAAMATLAVPLADPIGSPKHVSADSYYKIPVRPIYKSYPVYAPGHEPPNYMEWLKPQEPEVLWDDAGHRPRLDTEADWIKAREMVFDAPVTFSGLAATSDVRDPEWYRKTGVPVLKDGTMPFDSYVIREKGKVELGTSSRAALLGVAMPATHTQN